MNENQSAHQLIKNASGFYLDAYDPATPAVFEWTDKPASAWVFHPTNPKGAEMVAKLCKSGFPDSRLVDRAHEVSTHGRK